MLHILRDPRTMLVVLVIPVTLILLFGFTVSTDVQQIDVAVCAPRRSAAVDESVRHLGASNLITLKGFVDERDIDKVLRTGAAAAVVCYAPDYVTSGRLQILLDGADVNTATITQAYLQQILSGSAAQPSWVDMHHIFNPQMKSSFNFIPGIMGMIFLLICAMMTSVSIVKEKETGTMEVLLVSPVKPAYIIISKMVGRELKQRFNKTLRDPEEVVLQVNNFTSMDPKSFFPSLYNAFKRSTLLLIVEFALSSSIR